MKEYLVIFPPGCLTNIVTNGTAKGINETIITTRIMIIIVPQPTFRIEPFKTRLDMAIKLTLRRCVIYDFQKYNLTW